MLIRNFECSFGCDWRRGHAVNHICRKTSPIRRAADLLEASLPLQQPPKQNLPSAPPAPSSGEGQRHSYVYNRTKYLLGCELC
ncbi:hypothetical protein GDO78_011432 [Eleutherodactylus coqui]|uniref:Uncharacterized protein n=1 Tax=Eleutherodactylus coqui TaxID=57060 RepID=A0A8J6F936_ELECQ|nr:hypothetical protein GDO78_011432 [Eleutherodactylus coqui]